MMMMMMMIIFHPYEENISLVHISYSLFKFLIFSLIFLSKH